MTVRKLYSLSGRVWRVVHTRSYGEKARTKIHGVFLLHRDAFDARDRLNRERGQTAWVEVID